MQYLESKNMASRRPRWIQIREDVWSRVCECVCVSKCRCLCDAQTQSKTGRVDGGRKELMLISLNSVRE